MQVSTVLGVAIEEEREQKAWSEGVAIWVAVIVVSLVGEQNPGPQKGAVLEDPLMRHGKAHAFSWLGPLSTPLPEMCEWTIALTN